MKILLTSGYFDPLHIGHLRLFMEARLLGNYLVVIVNNDYQAKLKKGKVFMPAKERIEIVSSLRCIDEAVLSIDKDLTVYRTILLLNERKQIDIFAKGGDSNPCNTPELELCEQLGIEVIFGVGGGKIQSSSNLLRLNED